MDEWIKRTDLVWLDRVEIGFGERTEVLLWNESNDATGRARSYKGS